MECVLVIIILYLVPDGCIVATGQMITKLHRHDGSNLPQIFSFAQTS